MSREASLKDFIIASTPIATLATGGIYDSSSIGKNAINRTSLPGAFDSTSGLMKPLIIVRDVTAAYMKGTKDSNQKTRGMLSYFEILLYNDGNAGYSVLDSIATLIINLIDQERISGVGLLNLETNEERRRDSLNANAVFSNLMFSCLYIATS